MSISIPGELKARMDASGESFNWSRLATEAFERALVNDPQANLDGTLPGANETEEAKVLETLIGILEEDGVPPDLIPAIRQDMAPMFQRLFAPDNAGEVPVPNPMHPLSLAQLAESVGKMIVGYHDVVRTIRDRLIFELVALRLELAAERQSRETQRQ